MNRNVDAVLPVAGYSKRMGNWKPQIEWKGRRILEIVVEQALRHTGRLIVVTGFRAEEAEAMLPVSHRLTVVRNDGYERGMLSSIQTALPLVNAERFLVFMGDMPEIPDLVVHALLKTSVAHWARPIYNGMPGHPVLIHRRLIPELLALDPRNDEMRTVLRRYEGELIPSTDPGVQVDLDTPGDFQALRDARS